jgi:hypothetical protein
MRTPARFSHRDFIKLAVWAGCLAFSSMARFEPAFISFLQAITWAVAVTPNFIPQRCRSAERECTAIRRAAQDEIVVSGEVVGTSVSGRTNTLGRTPGLHLPADLQPVRNLPCSHLGLPLR